jgi:exosortase
LLGAATAALVWPALAHAIEVWSTTEEFTYGFLILPVVLGLLWRRRAALVRSVGPGALEGLTIVLVALGVYGLGERTGIHALAGIAVPPLLWGSAIYLWGWQTGRELAFPLGFAEFGLAVYRGLLDSVGFGLQQVTAVGAAASANLVGLVVIRDGLILEGEQFALVVAQSCSGMSSLLSMLALGALWVHLAQGSTLARVVVLASIGPLVVVANTTRVLLVVLVASWRGQDAATGFFHGASSLMLFAVALAGLLLVSRGVGCRAPRRWA